MKRFNFNLIGSYLLRGTFIIAPIFFTLFAIFSILSRIDAPIQYIFYSIFGFHIYGLGLMTILVLLVIVGYLGTTILMDRVFRGFEGLILKIPIVKEIYKAIRDVIGAFASDKKKFEKPVLVETMPGIYRIGFITNEELEDFGIDKDIIAVYFPLSYAFTGELLMVKKDMVKPLNPKDVGGLMKFVISGGIVNKDALNP